MQPFVIPSIFTAVDKFTVPVQKMQGALVGLTTIAGRSGVAMQRSLQETSAMAMQTAASAAMIGAAILIPLGLATKAAMDFEKQMGNISTLVDTSKENMGAMGDELLKLASNMPVKISDLTESLYQIRSAGIDAKDAMGVLEQSARLSVAGLSSATDATKAVTSAMVSFKSQGLTASQIANSFFLTVKEGKTKMEALNESFGSTAPIVAVAGVALQEFNAATAAMTNSGMTAGEAQTALRGSIVALIKPTTEMSDLLGRMGYRGADAGIKLISKLHGIVPAMEAVKNAAASTGINVNKAFGRVQGLTAYTLLTGNLKSQFGKNLAEQMSGGDALTTAFQKQLGTTAAQAQIAKNNIEALGIRIGELLLPALVSILKVITPIIQHITSFAKNHKILTGIIVGGIAAFGVFAIIVAALSFTVGTVTKAIWLWSIATKAAAFMQGIAAVMTGSLNGALLAQPAAAKGAEIAMKAMNVSAMTLLATLGKIATITILVAGIWKLFDKRDEAKSKMETILPHLPAGVDRQKFTDQFQDALSPGHIPLAKRIMGVKSWYPQETYDSLVNKYYDPATRSEKVDTAQNPRTNNANTETNLSSPEMIQLLKKIVDNTGQPTSFNDAGSQFGSGGVKVTSTTGSWT